MKKLLFLLYFTLFLIACQDNEVTNPSPVCLLENDLLAPPGFTLTKRGAIDQYDFIREFQFINIETAYTLLLGSNNERLVVFKTTDSGQTWTQLAVDTADASPLDIRFKDENSGIITVSFFNSTCPSGDCVCAFTKQRMVDKIGKR